MRQIFSFALAAQVVALARVRIRMQCAHVQVTRRARVKTCLYGQPCQFNMCLVETLTVIFFFIKDAYQVDQDIGSGQDFAQVVRIKGVAELNPDIG